VAAPAALLVSKVPHGAVRAKHAAHMSPIRRSTREVLEDGDEAGRAECDGEDGRQPLKGLKYGQGEGGAGFLGACDVWRDVGTLHRAPESFPGKCVRARPCLFSAAAHLEGPVAGAHDGEPDARAEADARHGRPWIRRDPRRVEEPRREEESQTWGARRGGRQKKGSGKADSSRKRGEPPPLILCFRRALRWKSNTHALSPQRMNRTVARPQPPRT